MRVLDFWLIPHPIRGSQRLLRDFSANGIRQGINSTWHDPDVQTGQEWALFKPSIPQCHGMVTASCRPLESRPL